MYCPQAFNASKIFTFSTERAEPFSISPLRTKSIAGRAYSSASLAATIPTKPVFQLSSHSIITFPYAPRSFNLLLAQAYSSSQYFCRSVLYAVSFAARSKITLPSVAVNRFNAERASPILPAAFILGAMPKAIVWELTAESVLFRK